MARGDVLFDLGFADEELSVPIVMTLVDLGSEAFVEEESTRDFLIVDSMLGPAAGDLKAVGLTQSQVGELLTASQLADRIRGLRPVVEPRLLDDMGL